MTRSLQEVKRPSPTEVERNDLVLSNTLGRSAVLFKDVDLGRSIELERANSNAVLREAQEDLGPNVVRLALHPSTFYSPEEYAAITDWDVLRERSSEHAFATTSRETLAIELQSVRERLGSQVMSRHAGQIDDMLDAIAPQLLKDLVEDADESRKWQLYASATGSARKVDLVAPNNPRLDKLMRRPRAPHTIQEHELEEMFAGSLQTPEGKWLRWMLRTSEDPSLQAEYDDQLLNFLQWHNHRVESLQHNKTFEAILEGQSRAYKEAIGKAEVDGWLFSGSSFSVEAIMDSYQVRHFAADEFTSFEYEAVAFTIREDYTAYNIRGSRASDEGILLQSVLEASFHEFNHLSLGNLGRRWLDEALTEHIAKALKGRDIQAVQPDTKYDFYADELSLLASILHSAAAIQKSSQYSGDQDKPALDIKDFTLAYSDIRSGRPAQKKLHNKIKAIFGFDLLNAVSLKLEELETILAYSTEFKGASSRSIQQTALRRVEQLVLQDRAKLNDFYQDRRNILDAA